MGYFPRWLVTWLKYWPTSQNVLVYSSWGGERVAYTGFPWSAAALTDPELGRRS